MKVPIAFSSLNLKQRSSFLLGHKFDIDDAANTSTVNENTATTAAVTQAAGSLDVTLSMGHNHMSPRSQLQVAVFKVT